MTQATSSHRAEITRRGFLGSTTASMAVTSLARASDDAAPYVLGYPDRISVLPGETIRLHISATVSTYDLSIERIGATRKVVWSQKGIKGVEYDVPADASANGCGWPVAIEVPIGADWASGLYEIVTNGGGDHADPATMKRSGAFIAFVVRASPSATHAKILLQLATNTDNAYNNFGGYSLYAFNGRGGIQGNRVSFLRPANFHGLKTYEIPFIQWAESRGYRLDYAVNNDLEFHPELLDRLDQRRLVLSVGHDEYWSKPMRDRLEAFVACGGNAAFFSGNTCCWQVRNQRDGLVCYKQSFREDPCYRPDGPNPLLSTLWSHRLIARPENTMTNVGVLGGGFHRSHGVLMEGSGAFTVEREDHWVFAGTDLKRGDAFGGSRTVVGYECDGCEFTREDGLPVPTGRDGTPKSFEILATAPATWGNESTLLWYSEFPQKEMGHACLGVSVRPGGGTVFTAGTTDWSHGLTAPPDPIVERVTRTVLDRLSSQ